MKATDIGGRSVRFKAEVDFDGREITRYYLEQQDLEKMLQVNLPHLTLPYFTLLSITLLSRI